MDTNQIKEAAKLLAAQLNFDAATASFSAKDKAAAENIILNAVGVTADDLKKARTAVTNATAITTWALQEVAPAQYESNKDLTTVSAETEFGGYTINAVANVAGHAPNQTASVTTVRLGVTGQVSLGASVVADAKAGLREALAAYNGRGQ